MTMGLMPVTGITLPLLSAGGSSIMSNMFAIGLVLDVDRELILVEDLPKQFREKPKEKSEFRFTLGILYENYKKRKPTGRRTIVVEAGTGCRYAKQRD